VNSGLWEGNSGALEVERVGKGKGTGVEAKPNDVHTGLHCHWRCHFARVRMEFRHDHLSWEFGME
jgi:hypothetical protein